MVRSIRFWCQLFRLLEDAGRPGQMKSTRFGHELLDTETGWDPYLEDPATLWLLHWQIFKPPFLGISWNIAFSFVTLSEFSLSELAEAIQLRAREYPGLRSIAKSSFEKDSSCMLRMYESGFHERADIRCPFTELRIIEPATEELRSDCFRFSTGAKRSLPDLIFMSAVFEYAALWFPGQRSLSLSQIVFDPNSPGMAFRLSETDCGCRIEQICRQLQNALFTDTSGIRQLQFQADPMDLASECLKNYYKGLR